MNKCEKKMVEILEADIVIVGCGAGGMSAALEAKDNGAKRVIVLEKLKAPGGNCIFTPLPLAGDDGVLRMACMDDDGLPKDDPRLSTDITVRTDANFKAAMDWNHWRSDARLVRTLVNKMEEVSDWIKSKMDPEDFERSEDEMRGKLARLLIKACKKSDIEIYCETPVKKLIKDENGRVTGVIAETKDGNQIQINGKAVIISTGGFIGSKELMEKYFHSYTETLYDDLCIMGMLHEGDGIKMALEAGAASDGTVAFEWEMNRMPWLKNPASPLTNLLNNDMNPEVVWVDKRGQRFADESKMNATNSIYRLKNKTFYIIMNQEIKDKIYNKRPDELPSFFEEFNLSGKDLLVGLEAEIQGQLDAGRMIKVDTIEEVAKWAGLDPEILNKTIDEYNTFCDNGHDDLFVKKAKALIPMRTGPYYAAKSTLAMLLTRGPLKVNSKMELIDKNDEAISGLYAAGVDIGGTDSDTYACSAACHSIGWALSSGRIAGENAAKALK